ncbi:MAG TPA: HAD family hydrolase [Ktedonobacterales bacterium]|nr:HAD family hydrolase [Ktedonobacterales bacterium]
MFIFFDIGDTLVDEADFARFRHASLLRLFRAHGCAINEEQYRADLDALWMQARMPLFDQVCWLAARNGGDTALAMAVFRDYTVHIAPEAPRRFRPFPDAIRSLEALKANGHRLGIIANQPAWIRARLRDWHLLDAFVPDAVVISDEVAIAKPRPEIFQFALHQAGVSAEEAVMVGNDYIFDIEPAKRLGMCTVWVEREDPYAPGAPPVHAPLAADARIAELAAVSAVLAVLPRTLRPGGAGGRSRAESPARRVRASQVHVRRPMR